MVRPIPFLPKNYSYTYFLIVRCHFLVFIVLKNILFLDEPTRKVPRKIFPKRWLTGDFLEMFN